MSFYCKTKCTAFSTILTEQRVRFYACLIFAHTFLIELFSLSVLLSFSMHSNPLRACWVLSGPLAETGTKEILFFWLYSIKAEAIHKLWWASPAWHEMC